MLGSNGALDWGFCMEGNDYFMVESGIIAFVIKEYMGWSLIPVRDGVFLSGASVDSFTKDKEGLKEYQVLLRGAATTIVPLGPWTCRFVA